MKKWTLALALLVLAAVGVFLLRARPQPAPAPQVKPAAVQPTTLTSGVVDAAETHAQLLAEAQKLPEPSLAPATARVPGQAQAQAVEALNQQPAAVPAADALPLDKQVFVAFTANVVGETDPCG